MVDADQIVRGVLDALCDRGVRVPDDIAVIGFDNWEPMTAGARPGLTTVDMNFQQMGRRAAERLAEAVRGEVTPGVESVAPRVVVRGSTVG
ncbi:substrate-binding domain-containing protein [Cellulomonas sp. NPDC089187]|uniref:substrate-binding domain-containing protein n=1 Tax=Cellulomonas sp. NPDC089187 TaxID=3154970 RepID=UPI003430B830